MAWPSRAAFAPATVITLPLMVRRALGMPRFSARLLAMAGLAMAGCGRRRWVRGADVGGELVRADGVLDVEEVVEEVVALSLPEGLLVLVVLLPPFLSLLRGASLIKPASLRWWSSSRQRMRRA